MITELALNIIGTPTCQVRKDLLMSSIFLVNNKSYGVIMNTVLWIFQGILAGVFMMTGTMKIIKKKEELAGQMGFVEDFSQQQVKGIGVLEILGAFGVILPWATGILTWLTPLAAVGLGLTMAGAFLTHLRRKELIPMGIVNIVLFSLAVITAVGRF